MVTGGVQETDEEPAVVVVAIDRCVVDTVRRHMKDAVRKKATGRARHADNVEGATAGSTGSGRLTLIRHKKGQSLHRPAVLRDCPSRRGNP
jgi:hypothetical protein